MPERVARAPCAAPASRSPTSSSTSSARAVGQAGDGAHGCAGGCGPCGPGGSSTTRARRRRRVSGLRMCAVRPAADRRVPAGRADQPEHHPQRRRLAGAVRAEEAGDRAGLDGEAQPVDGADLAAEHLGQLVDDDPAGRSDGRRRRSCGHRTDDPRPRCQQPRHRPLHEREQPVVRTVDAARGRRRRRRSSRSRSVIPLPSSLVQPLDDLLRACRPAARPELLVGRARPPAGRSGS